MADNRGDSIFILTSVVCYWHALYQIWDGQPWLIVYSSKRMPTAAKNYSITELELCGLAINISRVNFDAVVAH